MVSLMRCNKCELVFNSPSGRCLRCRGKDVSPIELKEDKPIIFTVRKNGN
jgi:uncharacterized OB-fold protein